MELFCDSKTLSLNFKFIVDIEIIDWDFSYRLIHLLLLLQYQNKRWLPCKSMCKSVSLGFNCVSSTWSMGMRFKITDHGRGGGMYFVSRTLHLDIEVKSKEKLRLRSRHFLISRTCPVRQSCVERKAEANHRKTASETKQSDPQFVTPISYSENIYSKANWRSHIYYQNTLR